VSNITVQHLAEVLLGIARAQNAIIEAMENSKAGFKSTHFRPTLESASRIRSNRPESLVDFPARLLLQTMGRTVPDAAQVIRDLEAIMARESAPGATLGPEPAGELSAPIAAADAGSLDMTQP
jgi:hypothetical protein